MDKTQEALKRISELESHNKETEKELKELRVIVENSGKPKNVMERVTNFKSACEELSQEQIDKILSEIYFSEINKPRKLSICELEHLPDYVKIALGAAALNEGWVADYGDESQAKYFPRFNTGRSGFGFSAYDCDYFYTRTLVGVRHVFKNSDLAIHAGKIFLKEYKGIYVQ